MAYNNYYPASYQYSNFLTQPQQFQPQTQPQTQTVSNSLIWVQGEAGAKS